MTERSGKRVLVAMSGGVDSSVTAALLQERGYEVVGVTMQLYEPRERPAGGKTCCSLTDVMDAGRVAKRLGIPFEVLDMRKKFQEMVIDDFVREYAAGRTPNPCARCNERIKFGALLEMASTFGADLMATGHYARIERDLSGQYQLLKGLDPRKDQSYFLFAMTSEQLARTILPIGSLEKHEVRQLAQRFNLPTASKQESQEICFIPDDDYVRFLEENGVHPQPGDFVTTSGRKVGRHNGVHQFTVGQRRGLGIAWEEPLYVLSIDRESAVVTVGPRHELGCTGLIAGGATWTGGEVQEFQGTCSIRYRQKPVPCEALLDGDGKLRVKFDTPQQGVTPGQAVVLYDGDRVVGGGWIEAGTQE